MRASHTVNSSDVPLSDLKEGVSISLVFVNCVPAIGINGGFWGRGVCGDEVPKNGGVGRCWAVDVVLRWLCAFRL